MSGGVIREEEEEEEAEEAEEKEEKFRVELRCERGCHEYSTESYYDYS